MKTNRPSLPRKAPKSCLSRVTGFSLIEAVVTIATLGILAGTAVSVISGANEAAHNSRLRRDVAVLNTAIASYSAAGGPNIKQYDGVNLIASDDQRAVNDVLNSLKSRIVNQAANPDDPAGNPLEINGYSVGAEGPFIDPQLSFESIPVQSGRLYAYWDQARSQFAVANDKENPPSDAGVGGFGPGEINPRISRFFIDDSLNAFVGTEYRPLGTRTYNTEDGWVWESRDPVRIAAASVGPVSRDQGLDQTPDTPNTQDIATPPTKDIDSTGTNESFPEIDPPYAANPQKLKKPTPNPPTTEFQTFASIQNVTLVNTNESGESAGKSYVAYRTSTARNAKGEPIWGSWVEGPLGGNAVVEVPKGSNKVPEFLIEYYAFSKDPNWLPSDNGDDKYTIAVRRLATPVPNVIGRTFNTYASLPKNVVLDNPNEDTNNEARGASIIKYRLADTQVALNSSPWLTASSVDDFNLALSTAIRYKNKLIQYFAEPKPNETKFWSKSSEAAQTYTMDIRTLATPVPSVFGNTFNTFASLPKNVVLDNPNEDANNEAKGASIIRYRLADTQSALSSTQWQTANSVDDFRLVLSNLSRYKGKHIQYFAEPRSSETLYWNKSQEAAQSYIMAVRPLATPVPNVNGSTFNTFASLPKNIILDNPNEDANNEARNASIIRYRLADTQAALNTTQWLTANSVDDFRLVLTTATRYKAKHVQYSAEPKANEIDYWSKSPDGSQIYLMARRPLVSPQPSVPPQLWLDYNQVPVNVRLLTPSINPEAVLGTDYVVRYRTSESNSNFNGVNWTNGSEFTIPRRKADFYAEYETKSLDDDYWISSPAAGGNYETIYFAGTPSTSFSNSVGDSNLQETYSNNNRTYAWGIPTFPSPYDGQTYRNTLNLVNGASFEASVNQEFKIADITYFNSTTNPQTNATGIHLNITLQGLIGSDGQPLRCHVPITLYSSPNTWGRPASEWTIEEQRYSADSLTFGPAIFGGSTTVVYKGRSFKLNVFVRAQTAYGFNYNNDPNDFRVFEFRGATGGIFGSFVLQ